MFANMKISRRLLVLIVVMASMLLVTGVATLAGLNVASNFISQLTHEVAEGADLSSLSDIVRGDFIEVANELHRGTITWEEADQSIAKAKTSFETEWEKFYSELTPDEVNEVDEQFSGPLKDLRNAFAQFRELGEKQSSADLSLFMLNDLNTLVGPSLHALQTHIAKQELVSKEISQQSSEMTGLFLFGSSTVVIVGMLIAVGLGILIHRSINHPIDKIASTVQEVASGDYQARTGLTGRDELGVLGRAFDEMLQEKVATLVEAEKENEQLNDSVISLLEAVSQLSERDLTVTVPVSEDVTGPVADAMNLMASETARVLIDIKTVAQEVESAANTVKSQGDKVSGVASKERQVVDQTIIRLEEASKTMQEVAQLAQTCNEIASRATASTDMALETVTHTGGGMNEIREIISETEKRIKRLGERSQEISGIVDIIGNVAERTNVLALNASMQAAAAGEAGRGFAVVADQVQRLAESSRNSTTQISALVNNIQTETAETMASMNRAISQVVEGSQRAEQAGNQMQETQQTTAELADAVAQIAEQSVNQAKVSNELRARAAVIQKGTQETNQELQEQAKQTEQLVQYAASLLNSVQVFQLPSAPTAANS